MRSNGLNSEVKGQAAADVPGTFHVAVKNRISRPAGRDM